MFSWGMDRITLRPLEEHDLARAHVAAPHVLAAWRAHDARHWRGVFLNLAVGAAVPLLGCLLLGWTPGVVLAALTADVMASWLCDGLKEAIAASRVEEERAHQAEAFEVLAVIRALERTRLPIDRDLLALPPRPRYYLGVPDGGAVPSRDRRIAHVLALLFLPLVGVLLYVAVPAAAPWLLAAAALRIGLSALRTLRARRSPGPRPELLGESGIATMALFLAIYPAVMLCLLLDITVPQSQAPRLALLMLALHVAIAATLAWLGMRRVRRAETALRAFAARDRDELRARLARANGP